MQLGMIGLGRMGANTVRHLPGAGHECVAFDMAPEHERSLPRSEADDADKVVSAMRFAFGGHAEKP